MPTQFLYIFHCRVSDTIYRRRGWQPTPVFFLAWEIPWTEEPVRLQSTGMQRILEWVATPFTRRSSQPRVQTQVPCIAGGFLFLFFLPPEPPGKPKSVRLDGSINTYLHRGGRSFPPAKAGDKRHGFNPWVGKIPWKSAWQPTLIFWPRESHGQRTLVGYRPQGCKELATTEATQHAHTHQVVDNI